MAKGVMGGKLLHTHNPKSHSLPPPTDLDTQKLTLCSVRAPVTTPEAPAAAGVGFTEDVGTDAMGLVAIGGTGGGTEGGGPAVEEGCGGAAGGGGASEGAGGAAAAGCSAVGSVFFGGASPARTLEKSWLQALTMQPGYKPQPTMINAYLSNDNKW